MKIDINKVQKAKDILFEMTGVMFCDVCGETNPKHGFFPLFHSPSVSGVTCNRCYWNDEKYKEYFGEDK